VKQGLILGEQAEKSTFLNEHDAGRLLVVYSSVQRCEELRLFFPGLEFDNLKPLLRSGIFKCISRLNGSFFGGR
jgi:hypothetical protein